jgi:hypothetical protein
MGFAEFRQPIEEGTMKTPLFFLLMAATVTTVAVGARQKGTYTNYGTGVSSCGRWIVETGDVHFMNVNWVLGFLSGVGYAATRDLRETDSAGIDKWITKYCEEHPLDTVATAAQALVRELTTR